MTTLGIVTAAVLVLTALAVFVLAAFGARQIARLGPWRLALIVGTGVALGLLMPLPGQPACAAPEPNLGCCTLCDGSMIGQVSRPACFNVYNGVQWSQAACVCSYGCCTLCDGSRINDVSQFECFTTHGGVSWYSGFCN